MKLSSVIYVLLFLTVTVGYSCKSTTNEKNYFAETGLKLPSSSNAEMKQLLSELPGLYNDLCVAVEKDDKDARPELSNSYANWLIQVIELKDNLPEDEKKKITIELENINVKWIEQIDKLL